MYSVASKDIHHFTVGNVELLVCETV